MTNAHVSAQALHVSQLKDITHQAVIFTQKNLLVVAGNDPRCILSPML
jgi:hypothetical protein